MLRILLAMQICFVPWALYFGGRLWAHHYEPLIPIAYASLALALPAVLGDPAAKWRRWVYATPFAVLLVLNAAGIDDEAAALRAKGGIGLYSDAINHFADDILRDWRDDYVVMPGLGLVHVSGVPHRWHGGNGYLRTISTRPRRALLWTERVGCVD
jgi:hypothetical protein